MNSPAVYVAFPVFNRIESTKSLLTDLEKQTYERIKVVVCDDGSTDGTHEYIKHHFPDVKIVPGTGHLWWTGGINKCVEYILSDALTSDLVLTINNDVRIECEYISQKVERHRKMPDAIIGSVCVFLDDPGVIETAGMILDKKKLAIRPLVKGCSRLSGVAYSGCVPVTNLPGKGVLIPINVYRRIGLYDQSSFPHYHADSDFTLRAHEAGIPVFVDFDSIVHSDVNKNNMNYATGKLSLSGIINSYRGAYSCNSFRPYHALARKHVPEKWRRFLVLTYIRILGGQIKRYLLQYRNK